MLIRKLLERNRLFIAIFFTIFIALISLVSLKGVHLLKASNSDKIGHILAYFILCLSWLNALKNFPPRKNRKYLLIFFLVSYGIILEVLQDVLTTYRQADLYDIIANSMGVILAFFLFEKLNRTF